MRGLQSIHDLWINIMMHDMRSLHIHIQQQPCVKECSTRWKHNIIFNSVQISEWFYAFHPQSLQTPQQRCEIPTITGMKYLWTWWKRSCVQMLLANACTELLHIHTSAAPQNNDKASLPVRSSLSLFHYLQEQRKEGTRKNWFLCTRVVIVFLILHTSNLRTKAPREISHNNRHTDPEEEQSSQKTHNRGHKNGTNPQGFKRRARTSIQKNLNRQSSAAAACDSSTIAAWQDP